MRKTTLAAGILLSCGTATSTVAQAPADVPIIPRATLFGNPERANPHLSPDGKRIAFTAPVDGVLNVFVGPADDFAKATPVTKEKKRAVRQYSWAQTNQHIIFMQDEGGNENFHAHAVDVVSGEIRDLTPKKDIAARVEGTSPKFPDEILISMNDRVPQLHDVYRVNVRTGESKLVQKNDGFMSFVTDEDFKVRFAGRFTATGDMEWLQAKGESFEPWMTVPSADALTTGPMGFDKSGEVVYFRDSRGRDTAGLFSMDLKTGTTTLVAENPRCDVDDLLIHPTQKSIQGAAFNYLRNEWTILDKAVDTDLAYLKSVRNADINIVDRSTDDKTWLVAFTTDNGPAYVYRYDRTGTPKATFLFSNRPALEKLALSHVTPREIKARDGLTLVSYLTLPAWTDKDNNATPDAGPLPTVLLVHGGPWARDEWGYSGMGQWLANRGYAVLQVNFRGSTGFGKNFVNAGNKEWGGKMHDDLLDAVNWAVAQKIADKGKVAIMGGSYGGYATLAGLTFTPDVFACGVDIVGPSNINTLVASIPAYWAPMLTMFKERVGDFTSGEGRKFLESKSPLNFVDKIGRPLLIGQGANDPRVKQAEADQIVSAMQRKNLPVTYVLFPDEGHGFARPENSQAFNAIAEVFLAQHLGGRFEPIKDEIQKSTAKVPAGAEGIPGLKEAIKALPEK